MSRIPRVKGYNIMRKYPKLVVIMLVLILVICCAVVAYLNSNYRYSKLLVKAIAAENKADMLEIIEKKPGCVNTYPTLAPIWWQDLMDQSIQYPLGEACYMGNIEIVEILVKNGADVNLGAKLTPLSLIYFYKPQNWYDISFYLLENGASLNYEGHNSATNVLTYIVMSRPGIMSAENGKENSAEVLLAFHYALENCDQSKINFMRVLQHSTTFDRIEIVTFLLDGGYCDVNDTSVGMTALMFAARDSTLEMVQLLLDYGADKNIKDSDGKTAYDYAVDRGFMELAEILKP